MEDDKNLIDVKDIYDSAIKFKFLKNIESDCPISSITLHDIKINLKTDEDDLYLRDDYIFQNIRRGNCIVNCNGNYLIGRRGLIKFFDYKLEFEGNKLKGKDLKMYDRVMTPVIDALKSNKPIYIYKSEKANGENFQLSYLQEFSSWIIGSKNVSILASNRNDIDFYRHKVIKMEQENNSKKSKKQEKVVVEDKENKYSFVLKFAETWFQILENLEKSYNLQEFINDIIGYTLIGENVGKDSQHIKYYENNTIIFFAMVKNYSKEICLNLDQSYTVFKKYGLNHCLYTKLGPVNDTKTLLTTMRQVYLSVLKSPVEKEGEGSVIYFSSFDKNNIESVISMGKLKTFEYRIFRKIREKLKVINKEKNSKINLNLVEKNYKKLVKEVDDLLGEETSKLNVKCYIDFAKYVFYNYEGYMSKYHIFNQYAQFIFEMKTVFESTNGPFAVQVLDEKPEETVKMDIDSTVVIKPKMNKTSNNVQKLHVIIVFGLVGCGKSSVYKILKELSANEFPNLNVFTASSDQYRASLINEYLKEHPGSSFDSAFEKTGKNIGKRFLGHVENMIDQNMVEGKENFLYFDKNINPETIENTMSDVTSICEKSKIKASYMIFYPKTTEGIVLKNNDYYPFSWSFFIQCYYRVKNRKDHENLDGSKKKDFYCILVFFLKFFRKYDFKELDKLSLERTLELTLCEERQIKIEDNMIENFQKIFRNMKGQFPKDDDLIREFFSYVENNFKQEDFSDSREIIKEELFKFFESFFGDLELENI